MDAYQCQVCAHIYDPEAGDPDHGVPPGTRFEDISDDWICPVCGSPKAMYRRVERQAPA